MCMAVAMLKLCFLEVVHYAALRSLVYNVLIFYLIKQVYVFPIQLYCVFLLLVHGCVVVCI